jgi:hypothetical protein
MEDTPVVDFIGIQVPHMVAVKPDNINLAGWSDECEKYVFVDVWIGVNS